MFTVHPLIMQIIEISNKLFYYRNILNYILILICHGMTSCRPRGSHIGPGAVGRVIQRAVVHNLLKLNMGPNTDACGLQFFNPDTIMWKCAFCQVRY